jgi:hypothetical protein
MMDYREYTDQNLWACIDQVSIDTVNDLHSQLIKLGINIDDQSLEDIYKLIRKKVEIVVDN